MWGLAPRPHPATARPAGASGGQGWGRLAACSPMACSPAGTGGSEMGMDPSRLCPLGHTSISSRRPCTSRAPWAEVRETPPTLLISVLSRCLKGLRARTVSCRQRLPELPAPGAAGSTEPAAGLGLGSGPSHLGSELWGLQRTLSSMHAPALGLGLGRAIALGHRASAHLELHVRVRRQERGQH